MPLGELSFALKQSKFLTEASQSAPPLPPPDSSERSAESAARGQRWNRCRSSLGETRPLLLKFHSCDFSSHLECPSTPSPDKSQAPGRGGPGGARAPRTERTQRAARPGPARLRTARTGAAPSGPVGSPAPKLPFLLRNSPGAGSAPAQDIRCRGTARSALKCSGTAPPKPFKCWKSWSFLQFNPCN